MLEEQQLLSLVQLAHILELEPQLVLHVKMDSFVPQQDFQKDINVDLEPTTMDQLDVKPVNQDFTVLMERQRQKLRVILRLGPDSILWEEHQLVLLVLQSLNVRQLLITLVLKDGILNLHLKHVYLVQRLIIVSILISLHVLLENLLILSLHYSVLTVQLIITALTLRLCFHALQLNGLLLDLLLVLYVELDIHVNQEVQKCHALGMNGTL